VSIAASLLFTGAAGLAADLFPPAAKRLDAYFDALAKHDLAHGSIAISEKGVLKYQRSVGAAIISPRGNEPADAGTRYRIGAVSELFTATMVMQLVEGASITLDSKLAEFYPDLPNALDITYRDLLRHRSGLFDYTAATDFEGWRTKPAAPAFLLGIIAAPGASFPPGERVERSPTNYLLLGYVLEKVYDQTPEEILQRQITGKLGLARTYYPGGGITSLESIAYRRTPEGWVAQVPTSPSTYGGAGSLISTPTDLVAFIDSLFAGKLLTEHSLASMRNQDGGSGMGLWPNRVAGQSGYGHSGEIDGFQTCVYYFPDKKIAISYATNASILPLDEIVNEALSLVFERGRKSPNFERTAPAIRGQAPSR
jgi:CubicO group peptidase (beta-lactamase class C family)